VTGVLFKVRFNAEILAQNFVVNRISCRLWQQILGRLAGTTGQEVRLLIDGLSIIRGIKQDRLSV